MRRYEIYWARLDPVEGSEMGKTRPSVIVSDDLRNRILPTVVVCPLTSVPRPRWRTRLSILCSGKPADICVEQIRVLSKERLGDKLGSLSESEAGELRELLSEIFCEP